MLVDLYTGWFQHRPDICHRKILHMSFSFSGRHDTLNRDGDNGVSIRFKDTIYFMDNAQRLVNMFQYFAANHSIKTAVIEA